MPTAVSAPSTSSRKPIERSLSNPIPKKRRLVKRRGRAKDEFESDEEIEREVRTDSETDDDHSSIDSESDSESSSDDLHADAHSEVVTPSTTQSPPPAVLVGLPRVSSKDASGSHATLFSDTTNWAEMVADEATNGASSLPVIDFADMETARLEPTVAPPAPRARKSNKSGKKAAARAASAPPRPASASAPAVASKTPIVEETPVEEEEEQAASTSRERDSPTSAFQGRSRTQSARQAYQQRLETDPSFVPKVGEFWGHDDRLLDKEYRSLSGWWRGQWQSRGRGRGSFGPRGRGRGGFFHPHRGPTDEGDGDGHDEPVTEEVPPVDRQWTHDGFEEMKKRDERRRALQDQQAPTPSTRGFGFRGKGFVPARGRGGFGRGGMPSPSPSQPASSSNVSMGDRVWYPQKPERMWTKQHEIFLYHDVATKARPGAGPGVRIKLPGLKQPSIVRLPPRSQPSHPSNTHESTPSVQDEGEKGFTVRLPPRPGKEKAAEQPSTEPAAPEAPTTTGEELSIDEIFTVRPHVVPNRRVDFSIPTRSVSEDALHHSTRARIPSPAQSSSSQPRGFAEPPLNPYEQLTAPILPVTGDTEPSPQILETILRRSPLSEEVPSGPAPPLVEEPQPQRPVPPVLHPLQTSFSPVPPTSPPYGSPYAFAPALPPGVAVNHQGMPYEYATGRPVYIQPTPPPMFTPRPMMHGHHPSLSIPFVPSHLRHHSGASPDFLAHPHTPHTPPMASFVDPATGVPIFAPPRQSSRIEIRAPTDAADGKKSRPSHQRSGLSTSSISVDVAAPQASYFTPPSVAGAEQVYPEDPAAQSQGMEHSQGPPMDPAMAYAPYPQPYYYPEQYGYAPYVDMSQQVMHYEMYPPEHHPSHSQPVVYY
ncbi:hypothetical protein C2E23DRAFT_301800 [Lenzites betulinus]|nr:hypothetical protein C2E23DRAFT_301800 [Lenzites betulinus]